MPDRDAPPIAASAALSEAMGAVVAQAARREAGDDTPLPPRRRVDRGWLAAAVASWGSVAALLLFQPAVARGPQHRPWAPAPAQAEASLRYGLWLAHDRIESFRAGQNRLPESLLEAGVTDTSLRMTRLTQGEYAIAGQQGEVVVLLASTMAVDSFLGNALRQLRQP